MASGNGVGPNRVLALAGIQAGVAGALTLLAYLALDSAWHRRSIWTVPNLLASTFYGESAYRQGFGVRTSAGVALLFVIYGLLGALFGLVIRDHGSLLRVTLLGLIYGTAWFFLSFDWMWKHINPMVPLYSPDRAMLVGHMLFGSVMGGRFQVYRKEMSGVQQPEVLPPLPKEE
ncbi:MAG TPA: hypothetical protein VK335_04000 [Bryobacteraceae bacterium]|nr:hypothetical protein [Bryobacteraceae bacterium]